MVEAIGKEFLEVRLGADGQKDIDIMETICRSVSMLIRKTALKF